LGNFISNQTGDWKDAGLIFGVHIRKTSEANGATSVEWTAVEATPTWVRIERQPDGIRKYTVLPLAATVSARSEPGLRPADYDRLSHTLAGIEAHLRKLTPDKEP
jgi:poly-gamma-glutamate synthesis protein (capsule biosynthesis protein)